MIDVVVVGAGPVGLAAAIEARLGGLTVTVLERRVGTLDKACGEGLMPGAIPLLSRLGVDPEGMPLRGVSYRSRRAVANHDFRDGEGRGVRRTTLYAALFARALELGATIEQARVEGVDQDAESVTIAGVRARHALAADGLHSTVRRSLGLERSPRGSRRYGLRRHYAITPWTDRIEVHWSPDVEVYVTPVAPDVVGFAMLGQRGTSFDTALAGIPELADRLVGVSAASGLAGAGPLRQSATSPSAGRVLLVGDASGYVDAITGEGLRLGFDQARAAVASLTGGPAYDPEWRRITRDFRTLTSGLVRAANSPVRGAIVPAARALPRVYGSIVERLAR